MIKNAGLSGSLIKRESTMMVDVKVKSKEEKPVKKNDIRDIRSIR